MSNNPNNKDDIYNTDLKKQHKNIVKMSKTDSHHNDFESKLNQHIGDMASSLHKLCQRYNEEGKMSSMHDSPIEDHLDSRLRECEKSCEEIHKALPQHGNNHTTNEKPKSGFKSMMESIMKFVDNFFGISDKAKLQNDLQTVYKAHEHISLASNLNKLSKDVNYVAEQLHENEQKYKAGSISSEQFKQSKKDAFKKIDDLVNKASLIYDESREDYIVALKPIKGAEKFAAEKDQLMIPNIVESIDHACRVAVYNFLNLEHRLEYARDRHTKAQEAQKSL